MKSTKGCGASSPERPVDPAQMRAILLPMQINPVEEWQRLTAEYRQKNEGELLELASDFADLTPAAQQVLRTEFQSRGLGDPQAPRVPTKPSTPASDPSDLDPTHAGAEEVDAQDYTWLTYLCECETREQAWQLCQALRKADIDCGYRWVGLVCPQVVVAADQLEEARVIASRPIPQEIIEDSKLVVPDYVVPECPKCGAGDPTLESSDPSNHWRCEDCGAEWSDPVESANSADRPS
jgi:hypothetical protein